MINKLCFVVLLSSMNLRFHLVTRIIFLNEVSRFMQWVLTYLLPTSELQR